MWAKTNHQRERDTVMAAETDQIEGMVQGDGDIDLDATSGDFIVLPEDIYNVEFMRFEEVPAAQFGPSLKLVYAIVDGEYMGETVDELASRKSGPTSKLRTRAEVLLGRAYETGEAIRLVPLFGKRARAVVKITTSAKGGEFNRIENLLPLPPARSAQRSVAPVAARPMGASAPRSAQRVNETPF